MGVGVSVSVGMGMGVRMGAGGSTNLGDRVGDKHVHIQASAACHTFLHSCEVQAKDGQGG